MTVISRRSTARPQPSLCQGAATAAPKRLGIEIRAGIHTGECELLETDICGYCRPHRRTDPRAGRCRRDHRLPNCPRSRRRLGHQLHGSRQCRVRGCPGSWQLLAVDRHGDRSGIRPKRDWRQPQLPGPRVTMHRTDRAVEVMAKRTPWILRGMSRLTPATGRGRAAGSVRVDPAGVDAECASEVVLNSLVYESDSSRLVR